jgi:hypothetical protein
MTHRAARALSVVLIALVVFGVVLRLCSYLGNRSLWLDEAALAHNIVSRSFTGLLAPLDRQQVAPLGFLWLEKAAVSLFGTSEYALRLVPLLASIAALPLFALVARRLLRPIAAVFALALFATATPLLYFAAEMKQYALDVAVVLALFALAVVGKEDVDEPLLSGAKLSRRRATLLALVGIIGPWISQPSVFALGGVALYLAIPFIRARGAAERRAAARPVVPVFALWAVSGGASLIHSFSSVTPDTRSTLDHFWERGFIPVTSGVLASVHWLGLTTHDVFAWLFPPVVSACVIGLFVLGIAALVRRSDGSASLLLAPLAFALLASALRRYPVSYRLLLFTTPSLLLTAGAGAEWLLDIARTLGTGRARDADESRQGVGRTRLLARTATFAISAALALLATRSALTMVEIPFYREELRPVVKYLAQHRQAGDVIYVYYASVPAFRYYAARDGIPGSSYRLGSCSRDDWHQYVREVDALRGRPRVWFVMSHPFSKAGIREDSLFLQYFSAVGRRIDSTSAVGAELALYDLSTGSTSAAATSFVPPASGDSSSADMGCIGAVSQDPTGS